MPALPAALEAFAAGDGALADARALAGHAEAELLALVDHLVAAKLRGHLEALGEAGLGKKVKKASRTAAYKLKSAGVSGEVKKATGMDLSVTVDLDRVAIVGPPGLDGQAWVIASELGGAHGFEIDLRADGESVRIDVAEDLGRGRLRKLFDKANAGRSFLADAGLTVRLLDLLEARLATLPGGLPPSFEHAAKWRDAARAHGADPTPFDARQALAGGEALEPPGDEVVARLLEDVRVGYLVPPEKVVQSIDNEFGGLMHSSEDMEEDAFRAECSALLDTAADRWLVESGGGATLAAWLDADADLMLGRGDEDAARALLGLADGIRAYDGPGHAAPLLARAIRAAIDIDMAWEHRKAHIEGHAHH